MDSFEKLYTKFKKSSFQLNQFCKTRKINPATFRRKAQKEHSAEWAALIASRKPKTSAYALGRAFEYTVRNLLRKNGYFVVRSAQSKGAADLVALARGVVILVQCKRGGSIPAAEKEHLLALAERIGAQAVLADRATGRGVNLQLLSAVGLHSFVLEDFS